MADDPIITVAIDSCLCAGFMLCTGECPEVFAFDEASEQSIVRADAGQWYRSKATEIDRGQLVCPHDAILINGKPRHPRTA